MAETKETKSVLEVVAKLDRDEMQKEIAGCQRRLKALKILRKAIEELSETPNAKANLPERIAKLLEQYDGAVPAAQIAKDLGASNPGVHAALSKHPERFRKGKEGWTLK